MIYEIMNCEDFRENNTSFIVGLELADEFVADVYDSDEEFFYEYIEEEIEDIDEIKNIEEIEEDDDDNAEVIVEIDKEDIKDNLA